MTYATLDRIKSILRISTNEEDLLLTRILEEVNAQIDAILSVYTAVPVTDERLRKILAAIEADWAAGVYRTYVEPTALTVPEQQNREHVLVTSAKKRLMELIEKHLKRKVDTV